MTEETTQTTEPSPDLAALIDRGDAEGLRAALDEGAEANTADSRGVTLLARAAGKGDLAMVELLLERGAEVDRASDVGNTALMEAAASGHVEIAARLLAAGADPKHKNKWNLGAWDWAKWPANGGEVQALLSDAGA